MLSRHLLILAVAALVTAPFLSGCRDAASASTSSVVRTDPNSSLVFHFDHVKDYDSRDLSGLKIPDGISVSLNAYLPVGGTWDESVQAGFLSRFSAGTRSASGLKLASKFAPVPGQPNVMRVTLTVSVAEIGVHWIAADPAWVRPMMRSAGYGFPEPSADLEVLSHSNPNIWVRIVGSCPHIVSVKRVTAKSNSVPKWEVIFSEPVPAPAGVGLHDLPKSGAEGSVAVDIKQGSSTRRWIVSSSDAALNHAVTKVRLQGKKYGLAGSFGTTAECGVSSHDITFNDKVSSIQTAVDYVALARLLASSVFKTEVKQKL